MQSVIEVTCRRTAEGRFSGITGLMLPASYHIIRTVKPGFHHYTRNATQGTCIRFHRGLPSIRNFFQTVQNFLVLQQMDWPFQTVQCPEKVKRTEFLLIGLQQQLPKVNSCSLDTVHSAMAGNPPDFCGSLLYLRLILRLYVRQCILPLFHMYVAPTNVLNFSGDAH